MEQGYKQVKGELGWADFQVRPDRAIRRHWTLVCCAFSFCWQAFLAKHPDRPAPADPQAVPTAARGAQATGHPGGTLVLGLTPLLDQRGVNALMDLRGRGFQVALLVVSPVPFIHPGQGETGEQAFPLWRLQREVVQARYQRLGVPVVEWRPDRPLEAVVEEVRTFQRRVRGRA
jgi:uncharacterized protein (DUF58 family)